MFNNHNLPKSLINEAANLLGNTNTDFELPPELQEVVLEAARDYVMCPTQEDRKAIIEWHIDQIMDIKDVDQQVIVNFERAVEYAAVNENIVGAMAKGLGAAKKAAKKVGETIMGEGKPTHKTPGVYVGPGHTKKSIEAAERKAIVKEQAEQINENPALLAGVRLAAPVLARGAARLAGPAIAGATRVVPKVAQAAAPIARGALGAAQTVVTKLPGAVDDIGDTANAVLPVVQNINKIVKAIRDIKTHIGGNKEAEKETTKEDYSHLLDVLSTLNEQEFDAYLDMLSEQEVEMLEQILEQAQTEE